MKHVKSGNINSTFHFSNRGTTLYEFSSYLTNQCIYLRNAFLAFASAKWSIMHTVCLRCALIFIICPDAGPINPLHGPEYILQDSFT